MSGKKLCVNSTKDMYLELHARYCTVCHKPSTECEILFVFCIAVSAPFSCCVWSDVEIIICIFNYNHRAGMGDHDL